MKVLKFGGKALSSPQCAARLLDRVAEVSSANDVVVVVSAMEGVTDDLIAMAEAALRGDDCWENSLQLMSDKHETLSMLVADKAKRESLLAQMAAHFQQLRSIYRGVSLVSDLSEKTLAAVESYGERLAALLVNAMLDGSSLKDAQDFIITERLDNKVQTNDQITYEKTREAFSDHERVTVVAGFIGRDKDTGETSTLGRGGSDYTAALIAAALGADELEIWTDVDGFFTADPQIVKNAYTIDRLTYTEATDLTNFGSKVIYPPAIYPVFIKKIPIRIKNILNPDNKGTEISLKEESYITETLDTDPSLIYQKPIKGISHISGTTLITVAGLSMVGVRGVNRRIFTALADNGISVFMVAQASSENSTSIGVRDLDAQRAVDVLNKEYEKEIGTGEMYPMNAERGLATIAVVGENMRHMPGIAAKLFGTLGRSGISVKACAQGASETNISFVIDGNYLNKALGVIHDSFFLSEYKELNVFICGVGTVGSKLLGQIKSQSEILKKQNHLKINVVGIASSHKALFSAEGIDLNKEIVLEDIPAGISGGDYLLSSLKGMNLYNSVFVDCTANADIANLYLPLLEHNVSVVAANKIAASGPYERYSQLKQTAVNRGVKFLFETNVGAGLPIIGTINNLINSGDKILKIEAVVSGTLNYIFNSISAEMPFSKAVRAAADEGYSEPDPRDDLNLTDVVRKIIILAREAGYVIEKSDVTVTPLLSSEYFECSKEEFWEMLPKVDAQFEELRCHLEATNKRMRVIATMEHGKATVALKEVDTNHPLYSLESSNNAVLLNTQRYRDYPMIIQGYGAGASVTAAGVFANIMEIANI